MVYVIIFVLLVNICVKTHADIYASTAELEYLVKTRQKVINDLRSYINEKEKKVSLLKRYYNLYKRENERAMKNISSYISNPINAFITINSLITDLNDVEHLIKTETEQNVTVKHKNFVYPTLLDLRGTARGLSRLIKLYQLNVKDIADGKLRGAAPSSPMSSSDCYALGRALFTDKDLEMAIDWIKEAYRKYNENNFPYRFTDINILEYISYGYYKLGDTRTGLQWTEKILNMEPDPTKVKHSMADYLKKNNANRRLENRVEKTEDFLLNEKDYKEKLLQENYEELCRGDVDLSVKILSRLTCRYLTETHPFLKIAPIKMEIKYLDPSIVLYHDFLNDREIETMKLIAMPNFERSKISRAKKGIVDEFRISKVAWFYDSHSEVLQHISDRMSHVTGLNIISNYSQHNQICNYGIGGHFLPHLDPQNDSNYTYKVEGGKRIATVMLYLSDVPQGGATVFPRLVVRIAPLKGSAVAWFNLHSSGEVNQATLHGSCPVLVGSKWVCNKWIHQAGQELHKPCDLQFQPEGYDMAAAPPPVLKISRTIEGRVHHVDIFQRLHLYVPDLYERRRRPQPAAGGVAHGLHILNFITSVLVPLLQSE